jgi:hypothetical protein
MGNGLDVAVRECQGYLRVTLSGTLTALAGAGHYKSVTERADASGCARLLLDARALADQPDIPGIFEFMVRTYPAAPGGRRTACVDLPENMVRARFFEHLMQNNGRTYRLFFDEAEALAWLFSDQS